MFLLILLTWWFFRGFFSTHVAVTTPFSMYDCSCYAAVHFPLCEFIPDSCSHQYSWNLSNLVASFLLVVCACMHVWQVGAQLPACPRISSSNKSSWAKVLSAATELSVQTFFFFFFGSKFWYVWAWIFITAILERDWKSLTLILCRHSHFINSTETKRCWKWKENIKIHLVRMQLMWAPLLSRALSSADHIT